MLIRYTFRSPSNHCTQRYADFYAIIVADTFLQITSFRHLFTSDLAGFACGMFQTLEAPWSSG